MINRASIPWSHPAIRAIAPFALSVALNRGLSLISVPLIAYHLTPSEYGRFELLASFVAVASIVLTFAIPDMLFRFATSGTTQERRRVAAGIMGAALGLAVLGGFLFQLAVPVIERYQPVLAEGRILAIGFLTAAISPLLEVPLAWLRVSGHGSLFFASVALRSVGHIGFMYLTLTHGYGLYGIVLGNACVDALLAAVLITRQLVQTGITFDQATMQRMFAYGLPLLAGAIAIFILGAFDRWILALHVTSDELAMYGVATKVSVAIAFCIQPFSLWWNAKRLGLIHDREGAIRSARIVAGAFVLLAFAAVFVSQVGPLVVHIALPLAYADAATLVPWLVVTAVIHESCELTNAGTYAARHGYWALGVNAIGAAVALVGYLALIPGYGVMGAILATIAGQLARLVLFAVCGCREAPVPYPLPSLLLLGTVVVASIWAAPPANDTIRSFTWLIASLFAVATTSVFTGLVPLLPNGSLVVLQHTRSFLWRTGMSDGLKRACTLTKFWRL